MLQDLQLDTSFLSSGASRQRHGSIWTSSGMLYYASYHQIIACELEPNLQTQTSMLIAKHTLVGHTSKVLCLTSFPSPNSSSSKQDDYIVSSAADGELRVWKNQICIQVLQQHQAPVHALTCFSTPSYWYLASSDSLGHTRIWIKPIHSSSSSSFPSFSILDEQQQEEEKENESGFQLHQSWHTLGQYSLCLAMSYQPGSERCMLAAGTTKSLLHIYIENKKHQFEKALTLTGHEGWVNCLSFTTVTESSFKDCPEHNFSIGDILLASGAMDKYIRLWRFTTKNVFGNANVHSMSNNEIDSVSKNSILDPNQKVQLKIKQLSTKAHVLHTTSSPFYIFLDSVMLGHDDWINQVAWSPPSGPLRLLSASSDKSIFLWSFQQGQWSTLARVGEQGGTEQIFYSVHWSTLLPSWFCGTSYSGAIYVWQYTPSLGCEFQCSMSGHLGAIKKIGFDPGQQFVISCSQDRTTRLWAPLRSTSLNTKKFNWKEFSRIQVHGYDLNTFSMLDSFTLCSGADEKVIRVFQMPSFCAKLLASYGMALDVTRASPIASAQLPALGLSNKAIVSELSTHSDDPHLHPSFSLESTSSLSITLPTESRLLRDTLWPELEKLYGHPNELMAISCSPNFIASTCKSNQASTICIHDRHWKLMQELPFHSLTVNALKFSPTSGQYLISAGRDRSVAVWKCMEHEFQLIQGIEKCHARIIWDVDWDPDEQFFVTASRDKTIKVWELQHDQVTCVSQLTLNEPVTAIAVNHIGNDYFMVAGDELGQLHIYHAQGGFKQWNFLNLLPQQLAHTLAVNSLCWGGTLRKGIYLASCSEDSSLRIYSVELITQEKGVQEIEF